MPHEFKTFPITYFQTLVNEQLRTSQPQARNGTDDDTDVEVVDVDELIRKGQLGKGIPG